MKDIWRKELQKSKHHNSDNNPEGIFHDEVKNAHKDDRHSRMGYTHKK